MVEVRFSLENHNYSQIVLVTFWIQQEMGCGNDNDKYRIPFNDELKLYHQLSQILKLDVSKIYPKALINLKSPMGRHNFSSTTQNFCELNSESVKFNLSKGNKRIVGQKNYRELWASLHRKPFPISRVIRIDLAYSEVMGSKYPLSKKRTAPAKLQSIIGPKRILSQVMSKDLCPGDEDFSEMREEEIDLKSGCTTPGKSGCTTPGGSNLDDLHTQDSGITIFTDKKNRNSPGTPELNLGPGGFDNIKNRRKLIQKSCVDYKYINEAFLKYLNLEKHIGLTPNDQATSQTESLGLSVKFQSLGGSYIDSMRAIKRTTE